MPNYLRHLQKQYQRLLMAQKQDGQLTVVRFPHNPCPPEGKSSSVSGGTADTKKVNSRPPLTHNHDENDLLAQLQQQLQAMSEQYEALVAVFQQQQQSLSARLRSIEGLLVAREIACG